MENAATVDAPGPVVTSQEGAPSEPADQPEQHDESAPSQSDATTDENPETPKKPVTGGFQKRIETLVRQRHETQRELDNARREVEDLKRSSQPAAHPAAATDEAPKEADFTDYVEYLKANARHEARTEARAVARADREQAAQERAQNQVAERVQQRQAQFAVGVEQIAATVPDFREVANSAYTSPEVIQALLASDKGPALTYYLGLNPDVADRIVSASRGDPVKAAYEIARLESKADATLQSRTRSSAPRQASPLSPSGSVRDDAPSATDTMQEYARKYYAAKRKG